jgi:hypothetical protein
MTALNVSLNATMEGIEMHESIAARLKRWRAEVDAAPASDGNRVPVSALSRHISKVREAKRKCELERQRKEDFDGSDGGNEK